MLTLIVECTIGNDDILVDFGGFLHFVWLGADHDDGELG